MNRNGKKIKIKPRTRIVIAIVVVFVIVMGVAYGNLREKTASVKREQLQVEQKIKEAKKKKKSLNKEKKYINTKEYIEKMARQKFGLFYPDEYVIKGKE